jgi:DNA-directed RNA polymerase specialized sigma24 family protein
MAESLLNSLPEPQRSAVWMRVGLEHTDEEVARILKVPVGTVKSWVWRSMARLKAKAASPSFRMEESK